MFKSITNVYYAFKNFLLLQIISILKENVEGSSITNIVKASKKTNVLYYILPVSTKLMKYSSEQHHSCYQRMWIFTD